MAIRRRSNDFTWFANLFGFEEPTRNHYSLTDIQRRFRLSPADGTIFCLENGRTFFTGNFTTPSLAEIRRLALEGLSSSALVSLKIRLTHHTTSDILEEHHKFPLAVFQAASQFNCLEFPSPHTSPEDGITFYATDRTQGPACALACPAGTLLRNYFAPVYNHRKREYDCGQTAELQINNLEALEQALDNSSHKYWSVENGYTFSSEERLYTLNEVLASRKEHSTLRDLVKVGVQGDTEVVFKSRFEEVGHSTPVLVTQVYCSAISVAYSGVQGMYWEPVARLVLQSSYESTLWAAVLNLLKHRSHPGHSHGEELANHCDKVFLTLLGGGVFGNDLNWICESIALACINVQRQIDDALQANARHHMDTADTDANVNCPELLVHVCHMRTCNKQIMQALARSLPASFLASGK